MMKNATWKIMELQRERMFVVCCFVAVAIISTVQGQLVDVEPRNVTALEGESINLLCRWGQPLQYCRIQIPGEKILVLSPQFNNNPEYKYYGAGLEEGQCGVTINQIKGSNDGNVTCNLGSGGTEHDGFISLTVARPPLPPEFEIQACSRSGICEVGNTFTATCISRDGRPAAQLQWYFDGEPIQSGLGMVETVQSMAAGNTSLYTATQTYTRVIQSNDDRKYLTCQTPHITDRGQPPQQVQVQLQVRYAPRSMQEVGIYGLTIGQTALINVTIQANPRPRTEWFVDSMPIPEGTQNGRYEAYEAVDLGNGMFNATLAINSLTLQDTVNPLRLRASNEFGSQDYTILISSQEEASILDVGSIVGIVVGLVVLLIAVVLLIVARVTGRWCFAGKSSLSTNNMSNETYYDDEGAPQNALVTATANTNIHTNPINSIVIHSHGKNNVYNSTTIPIDAFERREQRLAAERIPLTNKNDIKIMKSMTNEMNDGDDENDDHHNNDDDDDNDNNHMNNGRKHLTKGNYNELGIPKVYNACESVHRWLPKQQRDLLQKQADVMCNRPAAATTTTTTTTTTNPVVTMKKETQF